MPCFCRLYSNILLCGIKNVVYLWCNSYICCQWQRLFSWLGFMWLVRLCHENCIKENCGFVECQFCAVKMVEGGGGSWRCFSWQIRKWDSWAFDMSPSTSPGKVHTWVWRLSLISSFELQLPPSHRTCHWEQLKWTIIFNRFWTGIWKDKVVIELNYNKFRL